MATHKKASRRFRLVYRRSSTIVKCVVLAALILSAIAILSIAFAMQNAKAEEEAKRQEAAFLEKENDNLNLDISGLGSLESDKSIAEKELGLVDKDTIIFTPEK